MNFSGISQCLMACLKFFVNQLYYDRDLRSLHIVAVFFGLNGKCLETPSVELQVMRDLVRFSQI